MSRHLDAAPEPGCRGERWARMRDRGASAVEYSLMLAAVAAVIVAVVFGFGRIVEGTFQDASDCLAAREAANPAFPDCPAQQP